MPNTLTHIRLEDESIWISWFARKSAIPSLVAMAQQKLEFLKLVGVLKLTVGDITILEQDEGEEVGIHLLRNYCMCSVEAVKFLLNLGADPNYMSEDGTTPFIIEGFCLSVAKVLLKAHANPNTRGKGGVTALMKGCDANIGLTKLLLQSGADVNE